MKNTLEKGKTLVPSVKLYSDKAFPEKFVRFSGSQRIFAET